MENEKLNSEIISGITVDPTKKSTTATIPNNVLQSAGKFCIKHKKSFLAAILSFGIVEFITDCVKKTA